MRKLEEEIGREDSILGDWNAYLHLWDEISEEDVRGTIINRWIVGTGWSVMKGDSGLTWERTREGRRESSRSDFIISKGTFE